MADENALMRQPELRQWDPPWYQRIPYAVTDYLYGPNANAQQGGNVNKLMGVENPFNLPAQAQEAGETLGRGLKFGDAATAGVGALGAGFAMLGAPGRRMKPHFAPPNETGAAAPKGITAYHGSPHDFERFDLSKIGSGEGAQAYGHGLYFAENEGVAKGYRSRLSNDVTTTDNIFNGDRIARQLVTETGGDVSAARSRAIKEIETAKAMPSYTNPATPEIGQYAKDHLAAYESALNQITHGQVKPNGRMYEVRINADPEHFLDWDKPLSQQSEKVRGALGQQVIDAVGPNNPGALLPDFMRQVSGAPDTAISEALKGKGIPGIRYLDQGSRAAGEGSRNYVVFDDKTIEILRKYGLLGAVGAGAYAGSGQDAQAAPNTNALMQRPYP